MTTSTAAADRAVVLYDGQCRLCTAQVQRLMALARPGAIEALDFHRPGALDPYPDMRFEACMQAMHLVAPDGRAWRGAEAIARVLMTRPLLGLAARLYFLPGLRWLCDALYGWVARRRYRFARRATARCECAGGGCSLHPRRLDVR